MIAINPNSESSRFLKDRDQPHLDRDQQEHIAFLFQWIAISIVLDRDQHAPERKKTQKIAEIRPKHPRITKFTNKLILPNHNTNSKHQYKLISSDPTQRLLQLTLQSPKSNQNRTTQES